MPLISSTHCLTRRESHVICAFQIHFCRPDSDQPGLDKGAMTYVTIITWIQRSSLCEFSFYISLSAVVLFRVKIFSHFISSIYWITYSVSFSRLQNVLHQPLTFQCASPTNEHLPCSVLAHSFWLNCSGERKVREEEKRRRWGEGKGGEGRETRGRERWRLRKKQSNR